MVFSSKPNALVAVPGHGGTPVLFEGEKLANPFISEGYVSVGAGDQYQCIYYGILVLIVENVFPFREKPVVKEKSGQPVLEREVNNGTRE